MDATAFWPLGGTSVGPTVVIVLRAEAIVVVVAVVVIATAPPLATFLPHADEARATTTTRRSSSAAEDMLNSILYVVRRRPPLRLSFLSTQSCRLGGVFFRSSPRKKRLAEKMTRDLFINTDDVTLALEKK
jgi:hypothetical protein